MPSHFARAALLASLSLLAACPRPNYPECKSDDDCKEHKEVCVNGFCKECRDDAQCKEGFVCKNNACTPKPQCAKKEDCPAGQKCSADGKCVAECTPATAAQDCGPGKRCLSNGACGGEGDCSSDADCSAGQTCENGRCGKKTLSCKEDEDCPEGSACVGSVCQQGAARKCKLAAIHFEYDKSAVKPDQRAVLDADTQCLKKLAVKKLLVEGHCDERGTTEYNLALGNRRAAAVKKYLRNAAPDVQVETKSYGKERPLDDGHTEEAWARNRRAELKAE